MSGYALKKDHSACRSVDGPGSASEDLPFGLTDDEVFWPVEDGPPPLPVEQPPTVDQLKAAAIFRRDELLTLASLRIAPLQDAADLDIATDADAANLKKWKQYRVTVNRVPDQAGYPAAIDWPVQPG